MISIIQLINEELEKVIASEGLADDYFEKKFSRNIEEPTERINAELIGYVDRMWDKDLEKPIPVYKNPSHLTGFAANTRAVLLADGTLFVAQNPQAFHENILSLLSSKGIIPYSSKFHYWDRFPDEFVAVERIGTSNDFTQSTAYENEFPYLYQEIFDIGNQRQPYNFEFIPDTNLNEMESPLNPNWQISYIPQGYKHNILDEFNADTEN